MATPTLSLSPTKRFFVEMLTRDIELEDAVLDLLDNCVDGALRLRGYDENAETPYAGFWAKVEFSAERFRITDNCGGIPAAIRDAAFRLGRPPIADDRNLPTVGTYGIGMKRAIFKLGRECAIQSQTSHSGFRVMIAEDWFTKEDVEDEWKLPVQEIGAANDAGGTVIEVTKLLPEISGVFSGPTSFVSRFKSRVSQYYSILMEKGFEVFINDDPVKPMQITFKTADFAGTRGG